MTLKPLYMWAGGKTRLLKHYKGVFPYVEKLSTYVEPFFGGGAVFGSIAESFSGKVYINDSNKELMGLLESVRDSPDKVLDKSKSIIDSILAASDKDSRKKSYYEYLNKYWTNPDSGHLYALMKLGFNGIWQTNQKSKGLFATPAGLLNKSRSSDYISDDLIMKWSSVLKNTSISSGDYRDVDFEPENALIYLDPPYRDSFTTYSTGFNDEDQKEVVSYMKEMSSKGATVLLANRHVDDDPFFEKLLPDADFTYFDVTYTAGRRKRTDTGFEAKPAKEFLAILKP